MKRIVEEPLVFPIGDKDYTVPPVGVTAGWPLLEILQNPGKHAKIKNEQMFTMAMGGVYEQMREDGAPLHLVFRAGMASLAHFQVLSGGGTSEAALIAAAGIWESGLDPEELAAWAAANPNKIPGRRTAAAGASTASTSGTSTRKASTPSPSPRRTSRSRPSSSRQK